MCMKEIFYISVMNNLNTWKIILYLYQRPFPGNDFLSDILIFNFFKFCNHLYPYSLFSYLKMNIYLRRTTFFLVQLLLEAQCRNSYMGGIPRPGQPPEPIRFPSSLPLPSLTTCMPPPTSGSPS